MKGMAANAEHSLVSYWLDKWMFSCFEHKHSEQHSERKLLQAWTNYAVAWQRCTQSKLAAGKTCIPGGGADHASCQHAESFLTQTSQNQPTFALVSSRTTLTLWTLPTLRISHPMQMQYHRTTVVWTSKLFGTRSDESLT